MSKNSKIRQLEAALRRSVEERSKMVPEIEQYYLKSLERKVTLLTKENVFLKELQKEGGDKNGKLLCLLFDENFEFNVEAKQLVDKAIKSDPTRFYLNNRVSVLEQINFNLLCRFDYYVSN